MLYCVLTVAYYDLRVRKEGFDLEVLASTLQTGLTAVLPQGEAGPELYRAVLDSVFATEPYQWAPPSAVLRLLSEWWDWLVPGSTGSRPTTRCCFASS